MAKYLKLIMALLLLTPGPVSASTHQSHHAAEAGPPVAIVRNGETRPDPHTPALHIGGAFTLTNQDGKTVTDQTYRGKYMLVFFGFTFCPDICPTGLQTALNAIDVAGDVAQKQVQPIFITIDPARDTPEKLKDYVRMFGPTLTGLTGTPAQIAAVARAYKVYYAKTEGEDDGDDYMMDHSGFLYLMGPDGRFIKSFASETTMDELANELRTLVVVNP
jgi:protein SCO1/2